MGVYFVLIVKISCIDNQTSPVSKNIDFLHYDYHYIAVLLFFATYELNVSLQSKLCSHYILFKTLHVVW